MTRRKGSKRRKRGPRRFRRGTRAGKRRILGKCQRLRNRRLIIGYVNIRGIRGSRYILEKAAEGFDILLFQETKLDNNAKFELEDFCFPDGAIADGLAVAIRVNCGITLQLLDPSDFTTPITDRYSS